MAMHNAHKENINMDQRAQSFDYDGNPRMSPTGSDPSDINDHSALHENLDYTGSVRNGPGPSSASQRNNGLLEEQSYQDKSIGAQEPNPELDL